MTYLTNSYSEPIIGCDYHPGFQQIACVNTETGELSERRLSHRDEAEQFYVDLKGRGLTVRVGMEASGHARWFERLLTELQFELWTGDAAVIRTKRLPCSIHPVCLWSNVLISHLISGKSSPLC